MGAPTAAPQGPNPLTQEILCGGEGSQLMDVTVVCMGDPLLVQDLHAPVKSTGNGTGTKGAAICGGPFELLILLTSIKSREFIHINTGTHKDTQRVVAYLHQLRANYPKLRLSSELCMDCLVDSLAGSSKTRDPCKQQL